MSLSSPILLVIPSIILIGTVFFFVFRGHRRKGADFKVMTRSGEAKIVIKPKNEIADRPSQMIAQKNPNAVISASREANVGTSFDSVTEQSQPDRWGADERIRVQLRALLEAEEAQRLRIDAARSRRRQTTKSQDGKPSPLLADPASTSSRNNVGAREAAEAQLPAKDIGVAGNLTNGKEAERTVLQTPETTAQGFTGLQDHGVRAARGLAEVSRIQGEDLFGSLCANLDADDPEVRNAAVRALYDFQPDRAATFTRVLRESSVERRRRLGAALANSGLAGEAVAHLTSGDESETFDAFSLLFLMVNAGEFTSLIGIIENSKDVTTSVALVKLLALNGPPEVLPAFRRLAVSASLLMPVRSAITRAIDQLKSQAPLHSQIETIAD